MEAFVAAVRSNFDFLSTDYGAVCRTEPGERGGGVAVVYALPSVELRVEADPVVRNSGGVLLRAWLDGDGTVPYEFDLSEVVWYATSPSPGRNSLPAFEPRTWREEVSLPVLRSRLRLYAEPVLRGYLDLFTGIVALRRAGAPRVDARHPRWRGPVSRPPLDAFEGKVNLPSPDGRFVATMEDAMEMGMSAPVRGTLRLSSGCLMPGCGSAMVWSDDSRHLAVVRWDSHGIGRLAVVRAEDCSVAELPESVGAVRLAAFSDGVVTALREPAGPPRHYDVSRLCRSSPSGP